MKLLQPDPDLAPYELRALVMVARCASGGLGAPQRAMIDAMQQVVMRTDLEIDALTPISPDELAGRIADPERARQLVRLMVALSIANGPPAEDQIGRIASFAAALRVDEPSVGVIRHLAKGRLLAFRLAFMRRSHVRSYLRNTYRMLDGALPMLEALLVVRGVAKENTELASRFHALEQLPADTLGRQFFDHCARESLAFPGEKGGFPIGALFHDFAHVLAGYDTSPEGEMKNAAFQAGFTLHDDDFFTMLFALVIHTAGINLTPFPMPVLLGRIGQADLARDVLIGWQRGAAMKVDLGDGWDFWQDVDRPIDEVRAQFGISALHAH